MSEAVLVHLAAGVGNIVFATPLLVALDEMGFTVDVVLHADYPETADLLAPWSVVRSVSALRRGQPLPSASAYRHLLPAVPPFYWNALASQYRGLRRVVPRPPQSLFYEDEQRYYLAFARALGFPTDRTPAITLPVTAPADLLLPSGTIVLAPGCKTGEMARKRWPLFAALAERFPDVAVVGTADDLTSARGDPFEFGAHVRSYVGLTLRQTAELLASASIVVANDSGQAYVAAAVGTPTIALFGPTPHESLGALPPNVEVLRGGLSCEPCWFGARFSACAGSIACLSALSVDRVEQAVRRIIGGDAYVPAPTALRVASDRTDSCETVPGLRLVSCIMPTAGRRAWIPRAIASFQRQDYPSRELMIVDDGDDPVEDIVRELAAGDHRIRYEHLGSRRRIGDKRNVACEMAKGDVIAHWDDDDWMSPHRLSVQMAALAPHDAAVCGLARLLFLDAHRQEAWRYSWSDSSRPWVAGGTMCYSRQVWERQPFPSSREGEDTRFVSLLRQTPIIALDDSTLYVACIHPGNTSRKRTAGARWERIELDVIRGILHDDWAEYASSTPTNTGRLLGQPTFHQPLYA